MKSIIALVIVSVLMSACSKVEEAPMAPAALNYESTVQFVK